MDSQRETWLWQRLQWTKNFELDRSRYWHTKTNDASYNHQKKLHITIWNFDLKPVGQRSSTLSDWTPRTHVGFTAKQVASSNNKVRHNNTKEPRQVSQQHFFRRPLCELDFNFTVSFVCCCCILSCCSRFVLRTSFVIAVNICAGKKTRTRKKLSDTTTSAWQSTTLAATAVEESQTNLNFVYFQQSQSVDSYSITSKAS